MRPYAPANGALPLAFGPEPKRSPASEKPPRLRQATCDRRADATARDPVQALADDPFPRLLQREDGRQGARHRADRRHPARQPRGRGAGRPQGGGSGRPRPRRQGHGARRHPAVDAGQQPRVAVGARRHHHGRDRNRPQARRDDDPEGRGPMGHPLRRPAARAAGGPRAPGAADPDPRDPRDGVGRGQPRGDRDGQPSDAGDELWSGRPGCVAADEDDPSRRRPSRLPGDRGPRRVGSRGAARDRPAGPVALLDRPHGRRLHVRRHPALLWPLRRHPRRPGLRDAVPGRIPARLRRRLVASSRPDRDRQEGVQPRPRRRCCSPRRCSRRFPTAAGST